MLLTLKEKAEEISIQNDEKSQLQDLQQPTG